MERKLRGERYVRFWNRWMVEQIINELPYYDYDETLAFYEKVKPLPDTASLALLGCNDRYYLLTHLLNRVDLLHPWIFDRCREVEASPDGHIDLWARYHNKTSLISIGGVIQEIMCDPNITIAIFSARKALAQEILGQIKNEFETNEHLKAVYHDILYANPRGKDPKNGQRPAKWSLARGLTVQRTQRPKEATLEAHGLIDGQPTGRHFHMHVYDDVVTQDNLSEELLKKTTERFEMADNLGTRHGVRKQIVGTRYSYADTYGIVIERGMAKPRIYPATEDGTINGRLVLLTPAHWETIKRNQGMKIISAQMLLNPVGGSEYTFQSIWLRHYDVVPRVLNVYILVDPSKGQGERSDRTAIAVVGMDPAGNRYLLDGSCHRMHLTERMNLVVRYKAFWENVPGVQSLKVGWERYGKDAEIEAVNLLLGQQNNLFPIEELGTPRQGGHSKNDRIERLEPDIRSGRFYLPAVVHHSDFGAKTGEYSGSCYWDVWTKEDEAAAKNQPTRKTDNRYVGQIVYRPVKGLTRAQQTYADTKYRIVKPLKRWDENKDVYDLTRVFMDEAIRHPFAVHDDLIDAVSRIYDINPSPPLPVDSRSTESIDVDDQGIDPSADTYDDA